MLATLAALTAMMPSTNFSDRAKDWRNGAVVYQVFIDRFAPPADLAAKRRILTAPRTVHTWGETPKGGKFLPDQGLWSHELEFWGGDIASLTGKLDYIQSLGADVLYLQPIQQAFTNHKYDAQDYKALSPEIGTEAELSGLIKTVHDRKMRIMLDGVFNHMGRTSPMFQEALKNPKSKHRDWYYIGEQYPGGYRAWANAANLPGVNLENKAVRDYLWNDRNSVVRERLRQGIDGWRLDVAFELGATNLAELTRAAHQEKPGSAVVGEISGYPANWFPAVDGVFNFSAVNLVGEALRGTISGGQAGQMLGHMVEDAGIENLLKSWTLTDNHDTPRLASTTPDLAQRQFLEAIQFTTPGCPVIYYGTELGMTGPGDPENRAPMRWDLVSNENPDLAGIRQLIKLRKTLPALRYGDFTALDSNKLIAYSRTTDKLRESVIVVANPTGSTQTEVFPTRIGRLMSWGELRDVRTNERFRSITGLLRVSVPAHQVRILVPVTEPVNGASPYNRVE
jgi:cyclomaltodextrinase / maltogenic alpha-amylase / neopullulanase